MYSHHINLPVNIYSEDEKYFDCLQWNYSDPVIKSHSFSFLYRKGVSTNILLRPLKKIEPWDGFYKKFKSSFFIGKLFNAVKARKIQIVINDTYYCCVNEFSNSFYHWFTEVLPKMIYARKHCGAGTTFYIPFCLSEYQLTSLSLCKLNFCTTKNHVTLFRKLRVVENFYKHPGYYHVPLLEQAAGLLKGDSRTDTDKKRKIYITRRNASRRKVLNENEILPVLGRYGFEILDFDNMEFKRQRDILVNTSILVSIHGAALTNMILMPRGSTIVEFLPKKVHNDKCYFILAGSLHHNYYYLSCKTNGSSHITSDFVVDAVSLEQILSKVVLSRGFENDSSENSVND